MAKSKIGIIGSGDVAKALGRGFVAHGHETKLSSRDPNKLGGWVKETGALASAGTFAEAAAFGDVVVLATNWGGTENAIKLAGGGFDGKVLIDATNPLKFEPGANDPSLALGHTDSGGEQVQRWVPGAKVVKAFNIVGNAHMVNPVFPGGPPTMWIAGNDAPAKKTVTDILTAFGWETVDAGPIAGARYLEPMCMLWVDYLMRNNFSANHAFKLLRK